MSRAARSPATRRAEQRGLMHAAKQLTSHRRAGRTSREAPREAGGSSLRHRRPEWHQAQHRPRPPRPPAGSRVGRVHRRRAARVEVREAHPTGGISTAGELATQADAQAARLTKPCGLDGILLRATARAERPAARGGHDLPPRRKRLTRQPIAPNSPRRGDSDVGPSMLLASPASSSTRARVSTATGGDGVSSTRAADG